METILESNNRDVMNLPTKQMMEAVHNIGIVRVEVVIKIDSRRDKHLKIKEKLDSIKNKQVRIFLEHQSECFSELEHVQFL